MHLITTRLSLIPISTNLTKTQQCLKKSASVRFRCLTKAAVQDESDQSFEYDVLDLDWDKESWQSAIKNPVEIIDGFWVTNIEGEIPKKLHGTYFRNGPGEIESFGVIVSHPFDAQGHIGSVSIKDGRAFFRSRFVKTKDSLLEERAKRRLFRGIFGTSPKEGVNPLFNFKSKNAGNTNIALHNGRLYALYEGYCASELDPFTLETLHPTLPKNVIESFFEFLFGMVTLLTSFFGKLWSPIVGSAGTHFDFKTTKTSAHPHRDYSKGLNVIHSYGVNLTFGSSEIGIKVNVYELDDDFKISSKTVATFPNFCMFHDIAFTNNYFIAFNSPCTANTFAMMNNNHGVANCIEWNEHGVQEIHLIPRPSAERKNLKHRVIKVKNNSSFVFHFINAYEDGDRVVIDAIHYPKLGNFKYSQEIGDRYIDRQLEGSEPKPRARRIVCDMNGVREYRDVNSRAMELPCINPKYFGKSYRYSYMEVALHPEAYLELQALGKLDMESGEMKLWVKDKSYFIGEPTFVEKPDGLDEDDGWIVAFGYDGTRRETEFVIFDAKSIENGPVATLSLGLSMTHGLHGMWTSKFYGPKQTPQQSLQF